MYMDQTEEKLSRVSRKDGTHQEASSSRGSTRRPTTRSRKCSRYSTPTDDNEGGGDGIECTGKYCGSCTAGLIADCVALCCCPCGLLNILAFTFVKVPWMVGRKCLGRVKNKRRRKKERKCKRSGGEEAKVEDGRERNLRKGRVEDGILEIVSGFSYEEEEIMVGNGGFSARFEAERVWLELYEDGHLGFGRVSFTGIQ